MAVDVSEPFISPRISFSYDVNNQSSDTTTTSATTTTTTNPFDFCITLNLLQQIASADELFYDGVLLPTHVKKPENHRPKPKPPVSENEVTRKRLKELLSDDDEERKQEKASLIPFWKFSRSTSLNSHSGKRPKRLLRSLSLKRLLPSNSTDSALIPVENEVSTVREKMKSGKETRMLKRGSSSIQSAPMDYGCRGDNSWRRSVTKKNSGYGTKMNPILNIPAADNMSLFGSGSLFCKPKTKIKTK